MKDKIKGYFNETIKTLQKKEMAILPASIAYYIVLAIIPIFTLLVLIASKFSFSIDSVTKLIREFLPEQTSDIIIEVISGKGFDTNLGIFLIFAIILASNGTYSIILASNTLYKVRKSDFIKNRIKSFILLIIIIILFLFLLVIPLFGDSILSLIKSANLLDNNVNDIIIKIFNIIKWPITFIIIYFNIKLIYTISPNKNIKSKDTTYGSLFTTIFWVISTLIFKFYIKYFARYDILYGNLSSIIITMIWLYLLAYIFVFGMALNANRIELEEE